MCLTSNAPAGGVEFVLNPGTGETDFWASVERWVRQELSEAQRTSAPLAWTLAILSSPIAADVSGFLTAKSPPKPQQESLSGNSMQLDAADFAKKLQRPVSLA